MQISLQPQGEANHIQSVESGNEGLRIKIAGTLYKSSLILTSVTLEMWLVSNAAALSHKDFERMAELEKELIILGTGPGIVFPPQHLLQPLVAGQIGLEVMDTRAACRTYNILIADGRSVAAALILPGS